MGRLSQDEIGAIRALGRRGVGSREIARLLNVDESTVRYHLRRAEGESTDRRKNKPEVCGGFAEFITDLNRQTELRWSTHSDTSRSFFDGLR